jgi:hypothetical protein
MPRSRQPGQSVAEFGIVAVLFTLLMFAVVDFGFLLNSWVAMTSASRDIARAASVGYLDADVYSMLSAVAFPGVSRDLDTFQNYCCGSNGHNGSNHNDKIQLTIAYYPCHPGAGCSALTADKITPHYWGSDNTCSANCHPIPDDTIVVGVAATGMEVVTPLVRPFFGCDGSALHCYVRLASTTSMRFEGP